VAAAPAGATYESLVAQGSRGRAATRLVALQQALAMRPNGPEVLAQLAFLEFERNAFAEARDYAQRATAVDPANSHAWVILGASRDSLRDRAGARAAYQSCVDQGQGRWVGDCRSMLRGR
jgi:Flp pilus assembly protein TadD